MDCTTFKMKSCSLELYAKAPLSLPVFVVLTLLFLEAATTGAAGDSPTDTGRSGSTTTRSTATMVILAPSEAEYATAASLDEHNDDGRLALTPFPGGEIRCASTSTDEEDEEVLSSSEEVDWKRAFASGEKNFVSFLEALPTSSTNMERWREGLL
jgi:hypothetical protein